MVCAICNNNGYIPFAMVAAVRPPWLPAPLLILITAEQPCRWLASGTQDQLSLVS